MDKHSLTFAHLHFLSYGNGEHLTSASMGYLSEGHANGVGLNMKGLQFGDTCQHHGVTDEWYLPLRVPCGMGGITIPQETDEAYEPEDIRGA
ncbi:hypothetical protein SO802_021597 [Lithocarpus litseifolius]|uniref:Uncharacterized protein n=1 Tax=Lithocarpus litseifolius TaxID=425828 RepID=A0AAW2CGN2_9ROSI